MSDDVRRYTFDARAGTLTRYEDGTLIVRASGELVPADDYDMLVVQFNELVAQADKYIVAGQDDKARLAQLEAENSRLQNSINDCSTEEGLCYSNELNRLTDRIATLEAAAEYLLSECRDGNTGWVHSPSNGALDRLQAALAPKEPT